MSVLKIKDANNQWIPIKSITGQPTVEQIQDAVDEYLSNHPTVTGTFTNAAKRALIALLEKVAYTIADGQDYLEALENKLFVPVVTSISAVFTQGSAVIYSTDSLDTLKQYLVVTATYFDSTTEVLTDSDYTLSGTLTVGTSTITVAYGGKTATFDVTVTAATDVTPLLSSFTPVNSTRVGTEVTNNAIRVYTKDYTGAYQGVYAPFTTEAGYSYKVTCDATITSGKARCQMTNLSGSIISGAGSATLSESGHIEYTFSHNSNIERMFVYCTWSTEEGGNVTYSNIKVIKFAEVG